jgi:Methyltransferase FkbM domain
MKELSIEHFDFLKIDVEGNESAILHNTLDLINENQALVCMEFNSWCQLAFADVNPRHFLEWLSDKFSFILCYEKHRTRSGQFLRRIDKSGILSLLHQNLTEDGCVTDLLATNFSHRLPEGAYFT